MTVQEVEQIAERVARRVAEELIKAIPSETVESQIDAAISDIVAANPDVVRIRYNLGEDHDGTPAAFFRVLISDELAAKLAARADRYHYKWGAVELKPDEDAFWLVDQAVRDRLSEIPLLCAAGRFPYINWRSVSEQENQPSKEWE